MVNDPTPDERLKASMAIPCLPMMRPPTQWPPNVLRCCECTGEIKNDTYVVRQGRVFCDGCAATVED